MIDLTREQLITIADAAKRLCVVPDTVYRWARNRCDGKPQLETVKVGGRILTSLEAIQRFATGDTIRPEVKEPPRARESEETIRGLRAFGIEIGEGRRRND